MTLVWKRWQMETMGMPTCSLRKVVVFRKSIEVKGFHSRDCGLFEGGPILSLRFSSSPTPSVAPTRIVPYRFRFYSVSNLFSLFKMAPPNDLLKKSQAYLSLTPSQRHRQHQPHNPLQSTHLPSYPPAPSLPLPSSVPPFLPLPHPPTITLTTPTPTPNQHKFCHFWSGKLH